jgi:hypothetical protein
VAGLIAVDGGEDIAVGVHADASEAEVQKLLEVAAAAAAQVEPAAAVGIAVVQLAEPD